MPSNALGYSYYSSSGFRNGSVKWQLDRFGLPKCLIFVRQIEKQSKMRNEFTISIQFKTFGYLAFQLQHHTTPTGDGLSVLCFIPTVSVDSTRCPLPMRKFLALSFDFLTLSNLQWAEFRMDDLAQIVTGNLFRWSGSHHVFSFHPSLIQIITCPPIQNMLLLLESRVSPLRFGRHENFRLHFPAFAFKSNSVFFF